MQGYINKRYIVTALMSEVGIQTTNHSLMRDLIQPDTTITGNGDFSIS